MEGAFCCSLSNRCAAPRAIWGLVGYRSSASSTLSTFLSDMIRLGACRRMGVGSRGESRLVVEARVGDGRPGTRGCKLVAKALNDDSLGATCLIPGGSPKCASIRDTTEGGSLISAVQRYTLESDLMYERW